MDEKFYFDDEFNRKIKDAIWSSIGDLRRKGNRQRVIMIVGLLCLQIFSLIELKAFANEGERTMTTFTWISISVLMGTTVFLFLELLIVNYYSNDYGKIDRLVHFFRNDELYKTYKNYFLEKGFTGLFDDSRLIHNYVQLKLDQSKEGKKILKRPFSSLNNRRAVFTTTAALILSFGVTYVGFARDSFAEVNRIENLYADDSDTTLFFIKKRISPEQYYGEPYEKLDGVRKLELGTPGSKFDIPDVARIALERNNTKNKATRIRYTVNRTWDELHDAKNKDHGFVRFLKKRLGDKSDQIELLTKIHDKEVMVNYNKLIDYVNSVIAVRPRGLHWQRVGLNVKDKIDNCNRTFKLLVSKSKLPQPIADSVLHTDFIVYNISDFFFFQFAAEDSHQVMLAQSINPLDAFKAGSDFYTNIKSQKKKRIIVEFEGTKIDEWELIN